MIFNFSVSSSNGKVKVKKGIYYLVGSVTVTINIKMFYNVKNYPEKIDLNIWIPQNWIRTFLVNLIVRLIGFQIFFNPLKDSIVVNWVNILFYHYYKLFNGIKKN